MFFKRLSCKLPSFLVFVLCISYRHWHANYHSFSEGCPSTNRLQSKKFIPILAPASYMLSLKRDFQKKCPSQFSSQILVWVSLYATPCPHLMLAGLWQVWYVTVELPTLTHFNLIARSKNGCSSFSLIIINKEHLLVVVHHHHYNLHCCCNLTWHVCIE